MIGEWTTINGMEKSEWGSFSLFSKYWDQGISNEVVPKEFWNRQRKHAVHNLHYGIHHYMMG